LDRASFPGAQAIHGAAGGGMDCFVAEFIIGPAEGGTRWLLAMTAEGDLAARRRPSCACNMSLVSSEGAGKAGCLMHPQPRVRMSESTRASHHRFTATFRLSLRNGLRLIPSSPR
jgi:hypothetical protein